MSQSQPIVNSPGRVFLERIVVSTHARISKLKSAYSEASLLSEATIFERRSLESALATAKPAIIAEVKRASPSKGLLRADFNPSHLATCYEAGGAAALSVVTEPEYFQGDDAWVGQIRLRTHLPILRKDFVLDPIQVFEAAAIGADAILLIARLLSISQMQELRDAADKIQLDVLFEAHDVSDLEKIGQCQPRLVGINSRNLDTFVVDTDQFVQLRGYMPSGAIAMAESGIESHDQIVSAMSHGYTGFLIGESLIRSSDPVAMLKSLRDGVNS